MRTLTSLRSLRRSHLLSSSKAFQQTRHFHPTRPRPGVVSTLLECSTSTLYGIHSLTCLPWVLSLPLTAMLVRVTVAMPLQIFTKLRMKRERDLFPLLQALRVSFKEQIVKATKTGGTLKAKWTLDESMKLERGYLYRKYNVYPYLRWANLFQIPVWLLVMESVRNICGDSRGFLRLFIMPIEKWLWPEQAHEAVGVVAEPSLATEGALWFPDLLAGDPTGVLPALLTASIIANVRMGWKTPSSQEIADLPPWEFMMRSSELFFKYGVYAAAIYIGFSASFGMPAALMIYWLTSTNLATLQTYLLDKHILQGSGLKTWKQIDVGYPKRVLKPSIKK